MPEIFFQKFDFGSVRMRHRCAFHPCARMEKPVKTTGIIGGMSWESSAEYYRRINESIKDRLGPTHSAQLVMYSMDFHPVARLELEERWAELAAILIDATTRLEKAGADFVIMASNTAHKVADVVQRSIHVPLLHIADVAAEEIRQSRISTVGLLGPASSWSKIFIKKDCVLEE